MPVEVFHPANREEWLKLRGDFITASTAGALLGIHPYTTPYAIWALKAGRIQEDDEETPALRRGRLLEAVAVQVLREDRPDWQINYPLGNTFYADREARLGATPDALATRPDIPGTGCIQFKSVSEWAWKSDWIDKDTREVEVPLWVAVQAIVEADLAAATWATVGALVVGRGIELTLVDVPIHEGVKRKVRQRVAEFWALLDSGKAPQPDWGRDGRAVLDVYRDSDGGMAAIADVAAFDELVSLYSAHKAVASAATKEADRLKPQIIELLGNSDGAETDAWRVTARTQHRKESVVKASTSRPLRITNLATKEAAA